MSSESTAYISEVLEITRLCPIIAFAIVPVFFRLMVISLQVFGTVISYSLKAIAYVASAFTSHVPATATFAKILDAIPIIIILLFVFNN